MINIKQKNIGNENINKIKRLQKNFLLNNTISFYPKNQDDFDVFMKSFLDEETSQRNILVIYFDLGSKINNTIPKNKCDKNINFAYYYKIENKISDITVFESNVINYIQQFSQKNLHCTFAVDGGFLFDEVFRTISMFNSICNRNNVKSTISYDIDKINIRSYLRFTNYLFFMENLIPYSNGKCAVCQYNYVVKNNKLYYCEKIKITKLFNLNKQKFVLAFFKNLICIFIINKLNKNFFNLRTAKKESNLYGCFLFGNKINTIYNFLGENNFKN